MEAVGSATSPVAGLNSPSTERPEKPGFTGLLEKMEVSRRNARAPAAIPSDRLKESPDSVGGVLVEPEFPDKTTSRVD